MGWITEPVVPKGDDFDAKARAYLYGPISYSEVEEAHALAKMHGAARRLHAGQDDFDTVLAAMGLI